MSQYSTSRLSTVSKERSSQSVVVRWLLRLALLLAVGICILYLIPGGPRFDPGPLNRSLEASAELGQRELLSGRRGPLPPAGGALLLRNARLVDATDTPPRNTMAVRIRDGRIVAIAQDLASEGEPVLDVGGATVMPGLADSHVHLSFAPGAGLRNDSPEISLALRRQHLKAYLAWGVTTLLDPAVLAEVAIETQAYLAAGHPGPRYVHLGPPLSTPGGYLDELFPPGIATLEQLRQRLDDIKRSGAVGAKLTFEPGMLLPIWQLHPPPMLAAIADGTRARQLPLYTHAMTAAMYQKALALDVHAMVHSPTDISEELLRTLRERGVFVITTAAVYEVERILLEQERLAEPLFQLTVPAVERATVVDPEERSRFATYMAAMLTPQLPGGARRLFARGYRTGWAVAGSRPELDRRLKAVLRTIKRMHDAGIPLVMGTDSGNWPIFPYYFHGPTSHLEVGLLLRAGLTSKEVLRSCTLNPARMLGLDGEQGRIAIGQRADLLIVDADPLTDLGAALRALRYVIRSGTAHTPKEWMAL